MLHSTLPSPKQGYKELRLNLLPEDFAIIKRMMAEQGRTQTEVAKRALLHYDEHWQQAKQDYPEV